MSKRFPRLTASEVEKVLSRHGFELVGQSGSHRKWWHSGTHRTVIVPLHQGRALPIGTLRQIVTASGILPSEWR
ncbi:MAG: hypothetical protein DCC46_02070 [Armatimonadetes bacterium]|nr:MAG: hypothetical protein DCC46_02070 [Armatimonadota bacterium]